jgi:hypothetical protein
MTPRAKKGAAIGLIAALALGGAGYAWHRHNVPAALPPARPHADALDAVPNDTELLMTLDLKALRASPLATALDSGSAGSWLGSVKGVCGFEPVDSIDELAIAAPFGGADGDFGIVGAGGIDQEKLLDCASKVVTGRGGKPVSSTVGTFKTVRDVSAPSSSATGEIAARAGGPLLIGSGDYMRSMIDAADGAVPGVKTNQAHAALRAAVADGALLQLSIVLGPSQRTAIAEEVDHAGGRAPAALKGVVAAALGAKVTSETVQAHAVILVSDEAQAKDLADALSALKKQRSEGAFLRILGLDSLVSHIRVTADGKEVHARGEITIEEAKDIVDRLSALNEAPSPPQAPVSAPRAPASTAPIESAAPSASVRHPQTSPPAPLPSGEGRKRGSDSPSPGGRGG